MDALNTAIEAAGGVGRLADAVGVTQTAVSNWRARAGDIPAIHCAAIERAAGGVVMRWHLRPNDWHHIWPELVRVKGAPKVKRTPRKPATAAAA
jgi:DNA-binding transcriptional regulator YdaS (Cro superfamily)